VNERRENISFQPESSRVVNRKKNKAGSVLAVFLAVVIWCGLVGGGYYAAKRYVDQVVQKVQQTNAMHVQLLNERLSALSSEMNELKRLLSSADQTISSTGSLQQELNARIEQLDLQMQELEKSLKILKEAP
jgi:chromosome segregation ATPase